MRESVFFIADDSAGKTTMLRGILHAAPWTGTVLVAATSEDAMHTIDEAERIDCAFIDYYIPSHNGPTIIAHLRTRFPEAKIALVSSADDDINAAEAMQAGANVVICSALTDSAERLKDVVQTWLLEQTA